MLGHADSYQRNANDFLCESALTVAVSDFMSRAQHHRSLPATIRWARSRADAQIKTSDR